MNRDTWNYLDKTYNEIMSDAHDLVDKKIRAKHSKTKSRISQAANEARLLNAAYPVSRSTERLTRDEHNTETAIKKRTDGLEKEIKGEINEQLEKFRVKFEASHYQDFGGSREAALQQHQTYLEQQKEALKGKAKEGFEDVSHNVRMKQHFNSKNNSYHGVKLGMPKEKLEEMERNESPYRQTNASKEVRLRKKESKTLERNDDKSKSKETSKEQGAKIESKAEFKARMKSSLQAKRNKSKGKDRN